MKKINCSKCGKESKLFIPKDGLTLSGHDIYECESCGNRDFVDKKLMSKDEFNKIISRSVPPCNYKHT